MCQCRTNVFEKVDLKAVIEYYEEGNENHFCQFAHDGATLINKDKC